METGDWLLDTRYLILDIGCWLLGTIAHEFDIYGPLISDFGLWIADFIFWSDYNKGFWQIRSQLNNFPKNFAFFWLHSDWSSSSGYDERWKGRRKAGQGIVCHRSYHLDNSENQHHLKLQISAVFRAILHLTFSLVSQLGTVFIL